MEIHRSTNRAWLTREQALEVLGVKAQTLYTYASRGWVRTRKLSGRRKLYARADVASLKARAQAHGGHAARASTALHWGEPVLTSAVSGIDPDGPYYRGVPAVDLVEWRFEEVCALLWQEEGSFPQVEAPPAASLRDLRAVVERHEGDAWSLVSTLKTAARVPAAAELALVLLAEHGLNASTFAARVIASTGASTHAAVVGALAALEGPLHGGATVALARALAASEDLFAQGSAPGFGHPLYPDGDPRAQALLERVPLDTELADAVTEGRSRGLAPNIDAALLALARHLDEPVERVPLWFAAGRVAGWIAHIREQRDQPGILRPRATYEGWA
ncbi:MAG: citrate synthase [Proteobacteria bacterium]|nr:citrate synthase [Pseudomonadota bacterium]